MLCNHLIADDVSKMTIEQLKERFRNCFEENMCVCCGRKTDAQCDKTKSEDLCEYCKKCHNFFICRIEQLVNHRDLYHFPLFEQYGCFDESGEKGRIERFNLNDHHFWIYFGHTIYKVHITLYAKLNVGTVFYVSNGIPAETKQELIEISKMYNLDPNKIFSFGTSQ